VDVTRAVAGSTVMPHTGSVAVAMGSRGSIPGASLYRLDERPSLLESYSRHPARTIRAVRRAVLSPSRMKPVSTGGGLASRDRHRSRTLVYRMADPARHRVGRRLGRFRRHPPGCLSGFHAFPRPAPACTRHLHGI